MNYSQKVARVFEIVDYFLLLPAGFGVIVASFMLPYVPVFTLAIWAVAAIGVVLLVGHFKHSRGRLSERKVSYLWFGTIFYNSVPLLFTFYRLLEFLTAEYSPDYFRQDNTVLIIWTALGAWWLAAVYAPAKALYKNYAEAQKYL